MNPGMYESDMVTRVSGDCSQGRHNFKMELLDESLKYLSDGIGCKDYLRSQVEVLLCESFSGCYLQKKDVFIRGESIHILSNDGFPMIKPYGEKSDWIKLQSPLQRKYKNIQTL